MGETRGTSSKGSGDEMLKQVQHDNKRYNHFLNSPTADKWRRIGIKRRAGVVCPLFSLYSACSFGIGDFNDLKSLIDWCAESGLSMIQLLPLNDLGWDSSPYNAVSSFALEPSYLALSFVTRNAVSSVPMSIGAPSKFADYGIKKEKSKILWKIFQKKYPVTDRGFRDFKQENEYWLRDYVLFKAGGKKDNKKLEFHKWIQWQLYKQLADVKQYAERKGVFLMGDLPLLVARKSADVRTHPEYFKINLSTGTPPDMFHKSGQNWGMPPYNWEKIAQDDWLYIKSRLKYAENFYHLFRIDHFIGLFRVWTFDRQGKGKFVPQDEMLWEKQGKKILDIMLSATSMLPIAEDLGSVPSCSPKVLEEYSICGTDWQRTLRTLNGTFLPSSEYRENSSAVISLHDSSLFAGWWNYETTDKERGQFVKSLCKANRRFARNAVSSYMRKCSTDLVRANLETINRSSSIFSIQLIQDWLCLDKKLLKKMSGKDYRINKPGTVRKQNWSLRLPLSVEELVESGLSEEIRRIVKETERC
jgi:4-alpha-glucanotransferase